MISVDRLGWGKSVISEANIKPLSKRKKTRKTNDRAKKSLVILDSRLAQLLR
jgi:hypothetical protein